MNEWINEWMNEWMNDNECGEAWKVIGMKKYVRISRFAHFKRLRDRPTNQPTDGPTDMTSYRSARTHLKKGHGKKIMDNSPSQCTGCDHISGFWIRLSVRPSVLQSLHLFRIAAYAAAVAKQLLEVPLCHFFPRYMLIMSLPLYAARYVIAVIIVIL